MTLTSNSPAVLVLTDIFGRCPGLEPLLANLRLGGAVVQLADPYQGVQQQFADEPEAYAAYIERCGHDAYAAIAAQVFASTTQQFDLALGFSAGATALWRVLAQINSSRLKQAILFYPGQIHQHLALKPQVPTQIIFGHSEPHFAVADICQQLQQQGVSAISTPYGHGFMNPASKAFNKVGYQQKLHQLLLILKSAKY
nr:dienelactone hydrolase family protein [Rheinheimera oceanensis]